MTQTDAIRAPRALCLGEGLVVLHPDRQGELDATSRLRCSVGGAEANVAGTLAALGVPTAWVSRLGRDPFGELVHRDLTQRAVEVLAERDPERPTGAYFKEPSDQGSRMYYHRSGSAATTLSGVTLAAPAVAPALGRCELVHTSGITAGILADGSDLIPRLIAERERHGFVLSVDLNWRRALWQRRDTGPLRQLLRAADVLLLGADEAEAVLGTADPAELRELLGERPRLVIKADAHMALEADPGGAVTRVPALAVDVVEPIGAGDGFAAGYLAGLCGGAGATQRLRLGHLVAASVLAERGDHPGRLPEPSVRAALLKADEQLWCGTRVGPNGVELPTGGRAGQWSDR